MSKDTVKQMFGKMEKDAALKGKYAQLMQAHQKETENKMAEKLIELGKTSDFAFSKEDLLAARAELIDKANSNKELLDGDLAYVAGGITDHKAMTVLGSMTSLGIGCVVVSIVASRTPGTNCGIEMSTTRTEHCN